VLSLFSRGNLSFEFGVSEILVRNRSALSTEMFPFRGILNSCFLILGHVNSEHGRRKDFFQGGVHYGIFPKFFQGEPKVVKFDFPTQN